MLLMPLNRPFMISPWDFSEVYYVVFCVVLSCVLFFLSSFYALCPILLMSLECPFIIAPLIFSIVYYCSVLCCVFNFYFVFVLCLVPNVAHVSGMSIHHCPHWFSLSFITVPCYVVFLIFILSSFHALCPMLLMSLECPFIIAPIDFLYRLLLFRVMLCF